MIHILNLNPIPFKQIFEHKKDVEMRTYDDRRKAIRKGDFLVFKHTENASTMIARVLRTTTFKNFEELYSAFDKSRLGYSVDQDANPKDMNAYYTDELIEKYGVVAIEISLIEKIKDKIIYKIDIDNKKVFLLGSDGIEKVVSFIEFESFFTN